MLGTLARNYSRRDTAAQPARTRLNDPFAASTIPAAKSTIFPIVRRIYNWPGTIQHFLKEVLPDLIWQDSHGALHMCLRCSINIKSIYKHDCSRTLRNLNLAVSCLQALPLRSWDMSKASLWRSQRIWAHRGRLRSDLNVSAYIKTVQSKLKTIFSFPHVFKFLDAHT